MREWAAILPLIVMMVWMGVYSQSFLPPVGKITASILEQTNVNVPYRVRLQSEPGPEGTPSASGFALPPNLAPAPQPTEVADAR